MPDEPAKVPHSPETFSVNEESSHVSNQPEKETEPYLPEMVQGNPPNGESEPEAKDSETNMHPSMQEYSLADTPDLQTKTSPVHTENQNDAETEMLNQINEHSDTEPQSIRRSERIRQPPRRLDYPELGNPLVTVVKSLFQGLSKAFIDSLNVDQDYWSQSQAFEITTPILE